MKSYRELISEISELRSYINDLIDRRDETGDPYNDLSASIDELEEELADMEDQLYAMVGC